jgi:hypothetical protein
MAIACHVSKRMLRHYSHIRRKQNVQRSNRSSRNRRTSPRARQGILDQLTRVRVWGTHIEHGLIELRTKRSLNKDWIAKNHPRFRSLLKGSTHKNPHNRSLLKFIGEL